MFIIIFRLNLQKSPGTRHFQTLDGYFVYANWEPNS